MVHVAEQALAHTIGDAVEAAYRRGTLARKAGGADGRLGGAAYLAQPAALVVPLRPSRQSVGG
jgi:hypothetical protein